MEKDLERLIEEKIRRIKAYLDETQSPEEKAEFLRWLNLSPENKALLERVQDEYVLLEKIRFRKRNDLEKGWNGIQKKMQKRLTRFTRFTRYAAVLVAVLLIGIVVYRLADDLKGDARGVLAHEQSIPARGGYKAYLELASGECWVLDSVSKVMAEVEGGVIKAEEGGTVVVDGQEADTVVEMVEYNRLVVPRGGEYKIVLADGSQVWVNSQSVLEFPARFEENERRVKLTGEAYFEVSRDVEKTFVVEVGGKEVKVLGTSFNVNDYDGRFATTLVTGKVEVRVEEKNYKLDPSMQIRVQDGEVILREVNTREFTAWKDGMFVFKKQKLQEVLNVLSRWYDIEVFYRDEGLKELHFTGTIERHNDIGEVVKFLERTGMVKFGINGRRVEVSR